MIIILRILWIKTKGLKDINGVSLKQWLKPKENSADPTLINKAFDSILTGNGPIWNLITTALKKKLQEARAEYFAGVEDREAVEKDIKRIPEDHLNMGRSKVIYCKMKEIHQNLKERILIQKEIILMLITTEPKQCKSLAMKDRFVRSRSSGKR